MPVKQLAPKRSIPTSYTLLWAVVAVLRCWSFDCAYKGKTPDANTKENHDYLTDISPVPFAFVPTMTGPSPAAELVHE